VALLPVAYVVLFGPAVWGVDRKLVPPIGMARLSRPLVRLAWSDVDVVAKPLRWYARLGSRNASRSPAHLDLSDGLTLMAMMLDVYDQVADAKANGEWP